MLRELSEAYSNKTNPLALFTVKMKEIKTHIQTFELTLIFTLLSRKWKPLVYLNLPAVKKNFIDNHTFSQLYNCFWNCIVCLKSHNTLNPEDLLVLQV